MQKGSGVERNKISDKYRGIDDICYISMSQELSSINEKRKILHWFHFSIPSNDALKHDNDERRDWCVSVMKLLQPESQVLLNSRTLLLNALCDSITCNSILALCKVKIK